MSDNQHMKVRNAELRAKNERLKAKMGFCVSGSPLRKEGKDDE